MNTRLQISSATTNNYPFSRPHNGISTLDKRPPQHNHALAVMSSIPEHISVTFHLLRRPAFRLQSRSDLVPHATIYQHPLDRARSLREVRCRASAEGRNSPLVLRQAFDEKSQHLIACQGCILRGSLRTMAEGRRCHWGTWGCGDVVLSARRLLCSSGGRGAHTCVRRSSRIWLRSGRRALILRSISDEECFGKVWSSC